MALKFGKLAPKFSSKTLNFRKYVLPSTPPPPPEKVYYEYLVKTWPMYLNDTLGDCVFACGGHMLENWSAHTTSEISASDADIQAAYSAVGGYVLGDPSTDNGAAITDFLTWWQSNPLTGSKKISAWASIAPSDRTNVEQAVYIFGGADIGFNVPQSAMDQFGAGQNWDVVENDGGIVGGHSVPIMGYGAQGCACITWGQIQYMSWQFFAKYCDEAYAIITPDWLNAQGTNPSGLDIETLQADLALIKA